MTEAEAKAWITVRFGAAAAERIGIFLDLVIAENDRQNLVAPSTIKNIWVRHALDSAQLVTVAPASPGPWIDIGTGGGFPGMISALLRPSRFLLVEPRRKRAEFLASAVAALGLSPRVEIHSTRIEKLAIVAGTLSARAVAPLSDLLDAAIGCSEPGTAWVLPRGRMDAEAVLSLRDRWSFTFHVEQSVTDQQSSILILNEVRRK